jgi:hypothetical protein
MQAFLQQQQLTIAEIRQRVIDLLHLDEPSFHHTLYQVGIQYLHEYLGDEDILIDFVARRKEFWSWWKTKWFERDQVLLETLNLENASLNYRHDLYADYHNPKVLACEIFFPKVVYGNNYSILKAVSYAS